MTLRATIEIVPFGEEQNKRELYRLNISNMKTIRDEGFGHVICKYKVVLQGRVLSAIQKEGTPDWETIDVDFIEEHDRRDGAVALVRKAAKLMEERA